ncbi:MAG: heparinase II/III family protein [Alphaproteobacteria bacterium]|nr:heparinase II/III family protein [Alphaproteobacteria bacterium]
MSGAEGSGEAQASAGGFWQLVRQGIGKLQGLRPGGGASAPDAPIAVVPDLWQGDAQRGARLLKGDFSVGGAVRPLKDGEWLPVGAPSPWLAALHSFTWLRDLRALGTDAARMRARALVADWVAAAPREALVSRPDVVGARIAAWLGHFDFVAASAEDEFRARLMQSLAQQAHELAQRLPAEEMDGRALTAIKGLIVAGVALGGQDALISRALKFLGPEIDRQILPDGGHIERSPAALLQALQDLIECRVQLIAAQRTPPEVLMTAIERMAPILRMMRHGDGGLALFNGSLEENPQLIELVLSQSQSRARVPSSAAHFGFQRLQAGRTMLLVDAGPPPPTGLDRLSHAGTLAIELSVGRDRMIVNCGASPGAGSEWRDALRATAAHSSLVVNNVNSSQLLEGGGLGRRPEKVGQQRHDLAGATWLDLSHDGYRRSFEGLVHHRRLYLAESGDDLRGEDAIEGGPADTPFVVRFHLHPTVKASLVQDGVAVLLRLPTAGGWKFRAEGARLSLEESIYLGGGEPRRTEQIVLSVAGGTSSVKWAIGRQG